MNQRWAEVLCVLAAGSIARLRGDRMSICSNLQWIEFDGSKGCVNSWEFSMGVQHMEACQTTLLKTSRSNNVVEFGCTIKT